jgi:NADPH-dependent 2,4-dienoyl-CoA reductase/sulfur reductase-like enzyme
MQAAISAAGRGHEVVLFEKEKRLGGALNFAEHVSFKAELYNLIRSMEAQIRALPVKVVMGVEATPELAKSEKPDVIISAVGAEAIRPPFPGIEKAIMASDLKSAAGHIGEHVTIIGGGLVGCEAAIHLAMDGKDVTIIEMASKIAADAHFRHIRSVTRKLSESGVRILLNTSCCAITDRGLRAVDAR